MAEGGNRVLSAAVRFRTNSLVLEAPRRCLTLPVVSNRRSMAPPLDCHRGGANVACCCWKYDGPAVEAEE